MAAMMGGGGGGVTPVLPVLPEGYIECEYISHSRNSYPPYINTGVKPTSEYRIVAKIENAIDNTEKWPAIFGIREANSTPRLECFAYKTYVQALQFTGSSFEASYRSVSSSPHTIDLNKSRLIYDGVEYPSSSTGSWTSNLIFVIGTLNNNGTFAYGYSIPMKFYYFKIYDGDTLVCDFIPAYKVSSQKYGFYDFVSATFFSSARNGYEFSGLQKTT